MGLSALSIGCGTNAGLLVGWLIEVQAACSCCDEINFPVYRLWHECCRSVGWLVDVCMLVL